MCLVVVALGVAPRYPFLIAANRDEYHARPTQSAAWWPERPSLLGGRDLLAGGTWLGADRTGRIAAVTNVREALPRKAPLSRGALVANYLAGAEPAASFAAQLTADASNYGPFNLLLFDGRELHYTSNRASAARLAAGVHAFSNAPLGVDWPKTASGRAGVHELLASAEPLEGLLALLAERHDASPAEERYRTAHFVAGPIYGTRCSTVVLRDAGGTVTFAERSFDASGHVSGDVRETFTLPAAPRP